MEKVIEILEYVYNNFDTIDGHGLCVKIARCHDIKSYNAHDIREANNYLEINQPSKTINSSFYYSIFYRKNSKSYDTWWKNNYFGKRERKRFLKFLIEKAKAQEIIKVYNNILQFNIRSGICNAITRAWARKDISIYESDLAIEHIRLERPTLFNNTQYLFVEKGFIRYTVQSVFYWKANAEEVRVLFIKHLIKKLQKYD